MGRRSIYPITPEQLEQGLKRLVETGRHLDGKNARVPKPQYFLNFQFVHLDTDENVGTPGMLIADREQKIWMRCRLHDQKFVSSARVLFNASEHFTGSTCRFCERDNGKGVRFATLEEAVKRLESDPHSNWRVQSSFIDSPNFEPGRFVQTTDYIPVECKNRKFASDEPCGMQVEHNWSNLLHAMEHHDRAGIIVCQGECDSSAKGKSQRMTLGELQERLAAVRAGQWTISDESLYRKISEKIWFKHTPCGHEVSRLPRQVLDYPRENGLAPETGDDCPYCQRQSAFQALDRSVEHYARWVGEVTRNKVCYASDIFPDDLNQLDLKCGCGNQYQAGEEDLLRYKYYGCRSCAKNAMGEQRAWVLLEARDIVRRRGFELQGDPMAFTSNCTMVTLQGDFVPYQTIKELVSALPAHAEGFGKVTFGKSDAEMLGEHTPERTGQRYCAEEDERLRRMANTMQYSEMATNLGRSVDSVKGRCSALGLKNNEREHFKRRMHVWDGAFEEMTPQACYWAGLIATDGSISSRNNEIKLSLKAVDEGVLQAFAKYIGYGGNMSYKTLAITEGRGIYSEICFRSAQMKRDLERNFGITPRKTYTLPAPKFQNDAQILGYMVGLIEGDGSVEQRPRGGKRVRFVSASIELMNWFAEKAILITGAKTSPRQHMVNNSASQTWEISFDFQQGKCLHDALADTGHGTMTRKWQREVSAGCFDQPRPQIPERPSTGGMVGIRSPATFDGGQIEFTWD